MSVHLSQPDIQLRKEAWSDDVFAKIEKAGDVRLDAQQRLTLQANVERYEDDVRRWQEMNDSASNDRKRLDMFIEKLGEMILTLKKSERVEAVIFWRAGLSLEEESARLQSLHQHFINVRKELGRPGPKSNIFLPDILARLESLFLKAGGASTEVSRPGEDRTRKSPFIDFAWTVLHQVTKSMRPASGQALAVAWERIRQKLPQASRSSPMTPT